MNSQRVTGRVNLPETMTLVIDESNTAYLTFIKTAEPLQTWSIGAHVDVDPHGNVVGIKFLQWPPFDHMCAGGFHGTVCWTCGGSLLHEPDPKTQKLVQQMLTGIRNNHKENS